MLGTAEMPVTPRSATARRMSAGIHESRITSVAPATNEAMSWLRPTSNENGSTLRSTSRSVRPNHSVSVTALSKRSCLPTSTPLGTPVDPDVNRHTAGESGSSAGRSVPAMGTGQSARSATSRSSPGRLLVHGHEARTAQKPPARCADRGADGMGSLERKQSRSVHDGHPGPALVQDPLDLRWAELRIEAGRRMARRGGTEQRGHGRGRLSRQDRDDPGALACCAKAFAKASASAASWQNVVST